MSNISNSAFRRAALTLSIAAIILTVLCAQVVAMQYVNLPKYDIELTTDPQAADAGGRVQVEAHVVLLYYQMGTDPSVPDIYVEYELKSPSGAVVSTASGVTNSSGYDRVDMAIPSAPGEYKIVARAYDTAGGPVNGENEASLMVRPATGATVSPATATPGASAPLQPTSLPPTAVPTAKPLPGGLLGTTEILMIVAVVIVLILIFLAIVAVLAFLLLRKKKSAPVKPAEPLAIPPAPVEQAPERYCMHCGSPMGKYVASCTNCGQSPPSGVDTKECPSCHTVIPEAAKFCHKCGTKQPEKPT